MNNYSSNTFLLLTYIHQNDAVHSSDLKTCFEQLNKHDECRAIVLTGNGRAFSTGKVFFCEYRSVHNVFFQASI